MPVVHRHSNGGHKAKCPPGTLGAYGAGGEAVSYPAKVEQATDESPEVRFRVETVVDINQCGSDCPQAKYDQ